MKTNKKLIAAWFMCMVIVFMAISPMVVVGAPHEQLIYETIPPNCILPPNCDDEA
ncbi:MAG: hypothetical protein FWC32_04260 [Firmicutes bacterium]|nr:hypothetical protein [Bacillota bacterium]